MRKALKNSIAVLFWLLVWQLAATAANRALLLPLPTPVDTLRALLALMGQSGFWRATGLSLLRLIRAIPVAVFTIVVFLWVSRAYIPSTIVFLTVLPIVWSNMETGLRHIDRQLSEMAQVFGMCRRDTLRHIILPQLRPYAAAAIATGLGFAWKSGIAAEVICRTQGSLGDLLWSGKASVSYDEVFALTVVIVLCSSLLQGAAAHLTGKEDGHAAA